MDDSIITNSFMEISEKLKKREVIKALVEIFKLLKIQISIADVMNCVDSNDTELNRKLDEICNSGEENFIDFVKKNINTLNQNKLKLTLYHIFNEFPPDTKDKLFNVFPELKVIIKNMQKELSKKNVSIYYEEFENGMPSVIEYTANGRREPDEDSSESKRMKDINKVIDLENILNSIILTDIGDIFCKDEWLGELIRGVIIHKSYIEKRKKEGLPYDIADIDSSDIKAQDYLENFKYYMIKWADKIDIDKMLLDSAFRFIEYLEKIEDISLENIFAIKNILNVENTLLSKSKKRLSGMAEMDDCKKKKISFSVYDLENALKNFTDEGYLSSSKKKDIINGLLEQRIHLSNMDVNEWKLVKELLSQSDINEIIGNSTDNLLFYINNERIFENDIIRLLNGKEYSFEFVDSLIVNKKIGNLTIEYLYKSSRLSKDTIKMLSEKYDMYELLNVDKKLNDASSNYEEILNLLNDGIISIENVKEYISDDSILREYEASSDKDMCKLLKLYGTEIISEETVNLIVSEYRLDEEVINKFLYENILNYEQLNKLDIDVDIENIEKIIKEEKDKQSRNTVKTEDEEEEKIDEEKLNRAKSVIAYLIEHEKISKEKLDELYKDGTITEDDLFEFASKGYLSENSIVNLYINLLISEEVIKELVDLGKLSKEKCDEAIQTLSTNNIMSTIQENLGLGFNLDIVIPGFKLCGDGGQQYYSDNEPIGDKKRKIVIDPFIRDLLIKSYGGHIIDRVRRDKDDDKSPFDNYEFYIIADSNEDINPDSIVIAERYYIDRLSDEKRLATGNATYMFRFKDLARVGKKSKLEINSIMQNGTSKSVRKINHIINTSKEKPRGWARILTDRVNEWKNGRVYNTENKQDTETIIGNIDGTENSITGEWIRVFDIYSDNGEEVDYEDNR